MYRKSYCDKDGQTNSDKRYFKFAEVFHFYGTITIIIVILTRYFLLWLKVYGGYLCMSRDITFTNCLLS